MANQIAQLALHLAEAEHKRTANQLTEHKKVPVKEDTIQIK
jgi:hypothetical protein